MKSILAVRVLLLFVQITLLSNGFSRANTVGFSFTGPFDGFYIAAFVGINNGNGRGSMDQIWLENFLLATPLG